MRFMGRLERIGFGCGWAMGVRSENGGLGDQSGRRSGGKIGILGVKG